MANGIYTGYGTIQAQVTRTSNPAAGAIPGAVYVDSQKNYYQVINGQITNVGFDALAAAGGGNVQAGMDAAIALDPTREQSWRVAAGLEQGGGGAGVADTNAKAQLKMLLDQWDLGSLTEWAWGQLSSGVGEDQILLSLRQQQAYKDRFGNTNDARVKAGKQALSETEILAYEKQAAQMLRAAGMPAGFYDQSSDFANMLKNDVSLSELSQRVQWAKKLAVDDPSVLPEEAQAMRDLYGLGNADLAAYILDPQRAAPLIEKQVTAAANAAAARTAGFGSLTAAQAERVSGLTSSVQQAQQGFQQLARIRGLFDPLPGETGADQITTDEAIAAQFGGNAQAQEKLSRRQRARQAAFEATAGDYSRGGLGKASTSAL